MQFGPGSQAEQVAHSANLGALKSQLHSHLSGSQQRQGGGTDSMLSSNGVGSSEFRGQVQVGGGSSAGTSNNEAPQTSKRVSREASTPNTGGQSSAIPKVQQPPQISGGSSQPGGRGSSAQAGRELSQSPGLMEQGSSEMYTETNKEQSMSRMVSQASSNLRGSFDQARQSHSSAGRRSQSAEPTTTTSHEGSHAHQPLQTMGRVTSAKVGMNTRTWQGMLEQMHAQRSAIHLLASSSSSSLSHCGSPSPAPCLVRPPSTRLRRACSPALSAQARCWARVATRWCSAPSGTTHRWVLKQHHASCHCERLVQLTSLLFEQPEEAAPL